MRRIRFALTLLAAPAMISAQNAKANPSPAALTTLDVKSTHYADVAKQIWGFAELGYQEFKSSALLKATLVLSVVLLAAYVIAVWAMAGKPN